MHLCAAGFAVLALVGCGSPRRTGTAEAPECGDVAAHLVRLAEQDNSASASPSLAEGLREEMERNCREQGWSAERRQCLVRARRQDSTIDCPLE